MCGNLFSRPKVETPQVQQVAPAPQAVTGTDTQAMNDRQKKDRDRMRARIGAAQMRSVLTDETQGKQTLG